MNRPCKELKRIARANLNGHYGIPMGALLVAGCIPLVAELPFSMLQQETQPLMMTVMFYVADFLITLLSVVLSVGVMQIHLSIARKQKYDLGMVFYGFKNHPDRYIIVLLLMLCISLAGMLPMIIGLLLFYWIGVNPLGIMILIPCILISLVLTVLIQLWYALVYYLVLDQPNLTGIKALKLSQKLMKGNKGRLFYIYLSFLGMQLLCLLSFGIGSLWVSPYQSQTLANFYLDITQGIPTN